MKRIISILIMIITLAGSAFAAGEKYDGIFDRPTHFPDFNPLTASNAPNNMSYFVYVVNVNGENLDNFEIAVYDQNNKLRATSRSRHEDDNQCMLTIIGDLEEEFHFEVLYGDFDNPTIQPLVETVPFVINGVYGLREDVFFHIAAEPVLKYWTTDYSSATPQGELKLSELAGADLKSITRAELSGSWTKESAEGLFSGCKSLLYVNILNIPGTTTGAFEGANPNCLVYLPTGTTVVPDGWTNCVADGKALTDINLTDGTTAQPYCFFCPQKIDLNGHQATFRRSSPWSYANGKGGWNTIVLPFDAEVQVGGEAVSALNSLDLSDTTTKIKNLWKKEAGYWAMAFLNESDDNLEFDNLLTGSFVANVPYMFTLPSRYFEREIDGITYSLNMEDKEIVFVGEDCIPATPAQPLVNEDEDEATHSHFVGTYQTLMSQPMYQLKTHAEEGYDAFIYRENGNLLPFRAYIAKDNSAGSKARALNVRIGWNYGEVSSGISELKADAKKQRMYDLNGRAVKIPLPKGIYINGDSKVVIK